MNVLRKPQGMSVERGPKSLHEHNRSLLYSQKPKFKEDLRDPINSDRIRLDGVKFRNYSSEELEQILAEIKLNAARDLQHQYKLMVISSIISLLIMLFLKYKLDQRFSIVESAATDLL